MPCYSPINAWYSKLENGKRKIVFHEDESDKSYLQAKLKLPCGKCIGCQLDKANHWAIRCMHEASMHDNNCFVTLTYNDNNLPPNGSLDKRDFILFMKKLRKFKSNIRFFHCGEYGSKLNRPHHHVIIFNYDFPDKQLYTIKNDNKIYTSRLLNSIWQHGFSTIGSVSLESASYVARYTTKKCYGEGAEKHYDGKQPEYITMSRKPGIGNNWIKKYSTDVYPSSEIINNGKRLTVPKYYDKIYAKDNPQQFELIKQERIKNIYRPIEYQRLDGKTVKIDDNSDYRLRIREKNKLDKVNRLNREWENSK